MPNMRFQPTSQFFTLSTWTMRSHRLGVLGSIVCGAMLFPALLVPEGAAAAALTHWRYDPTANQLEMTVGEGITPRYFLMAQPARIVLDLPDTEVGTVDPTGSYAGAVRQVRVSQFQPGLTRIVMELSPDVALAPQQVKLEKVAESGSAIGDRWIVRPVLSTPLASVPGVVSSRVQPVPPPPAKLFAVGSDARPVTDKDEVAAEQSLPSRPPVQQIAQASPIETTTPLPPTIDAAVNPQQSGEGFQVEVPPPVALPGGTEVVVKTVPSNPIPSAVIVPPLSHPAAISVPPSTAPIPIDVPQVVPATIAPALRPAIAPLPSLASAQVPPVERLPQSAVTVPPVSMQSAGQRSDSTGQFPLSGVLQTPLPVQVKVPDAIALQPTAPTVAVPPVSSVMQSSVMQPTVSEQSPAIASQPPVSSVLQPPVSSVMQSPMSSVMQSPARSNLQPFPTTPIQSTPIQSTAALPAAALPDSFNSQPPLVSVPPLQSSVPSTLSNAPAPMVSVPPLQPASSPPLGLPSSVSPTLPPAAFPTAPVGRDRPPMDAAVEFGQPLPTTGATTLTTVPRTTPYPTSLSYPSGGAPLAMTGQVYQSSTPYVLVPMGTQLTLSYPGTTTLNLESGIPRQEVLLLQTEVRDAAGRVVLPQGSYVTGRFESDRTGSKFIAQGISVGGQTAPFAAESGAIEGNREISSQSMALNSGIGALALGLLSRSGVGALGGAAAGAATTYLIAPKPATIQPGQIIPVRVTQDLR